jgi:hypothetical protein
MVCKLRALRFALLRAVAAIGSGRQSSLASWGRGHSHVSPFPSAAGPFLFLTAGQQHPP